LHDENEEILFLKSIKIAELEVAIESWTLEKA